MILTPKLNGYVGRAGLISIQLFQQEDGLWQVLWGGESIEGAPFRTKRLALMSLELHNLDHIANEP